MSVQSCEGVWRNRWGQRVVVTECDPVEGQRWTDGAEYYSDDGTYDAIRGKTGRDLVSFVGPLPQPDETAKNDLLRTTLTQQTAEIDRLRAECADAIERLQVKWQSEFTAAQQLRSEVERLQAEWQSEFNAAQQLRSEVQQLELLLGEAREELQQLQADHAADQQQREAERAAYLRMIKALWEMRS